MRNKKLKSDGFFVYVFFSFCLILFALVSLKLYEIQVIKAQEIENYFNNSIKLIPPLRGNIYIKDKDNNLIPIALSYYTYDVYFFPPKSKNREEELKKISQIIQIDLEKIKEKVKENPQVSLILKKNVNEEEKEKLKKLNFDSIFFEEKVIRKYPLNNLLSTILGYAIYDEKEKITKGIYGLEKYYDEYLRGESGFLTKYGEYKPPIKGADLILNIDYYLQLKTQSILDEALKKYKAEGGLIVVVNAKNGKVLAIAESPNYDLNNYRSVKDYSLFISRISSVYEPGSVMKPFFYTGAFEENLVTPSSTYYDQGFVTLNNKTIYNFDKKGRGEVDLKTALEQSLNTGSVYISQILGKNRFIKYLNKFRFNQNPEIDFPLIHLNNLKTLFPPFGRDINFATASFGQGISISPISLLQAYQVFANKGTITNFLIVEKIIYPNNKIFVNKEKIISQNVISSKTISTINEILEGVVENQAKKAKIKGFGIGGKTGSAQILVDNEYSEDVITSFFGFFPLSDPKFLILVRLDKPEKGLLAFGTATPTFRKVVEFMINYYNIEPDKSLDLLNSQNF